MCYTNHIHADDLARIIALALFRALPGRIYNAVDDSDLKMGEYFDVVADRFRLAAAAALAARGTASKPYRRCNGPSCGSRAA